MKNLKELLEEEEILQLKSFSNRIAWEMGSLAAGIALERDLPVVINIDRYGQCLFHAALPGTGPDNTLWIEGKKTRLLSLSAQFPLYGGLFQAP